MLTNIVLGKLAQLPALMTEINTWATDQGYPKVLVTDPGDNKDYQRLVPDLYGDKLFRFTGFGWVFPAKAQFYVEYWPEGAQKAAASKRFLVSLVS